VNILVFSPVTLRAASTRRFASVSRYATIRCGNPLRGCLRLLRPPVCFLICAMTALYDCRAIGRRKKLFISHVRVWYYACVTRIPPRTCVRAIFRLTRLLSIQHLPPTPGVSAYFCK
jgi:hypothetical protein